VTLIESAHSQRSTASTARLILSMWCFQCCKIMTCLTFRPSPQCACRMLAMAMNTDAESPSQCARPAIPPVVAPTLIDPTTVQRLRSVTSTVVASQISKNNYSNELHLRLVARIRAPVPSMVSTVRKAHIRTTPVSDLPLERLLFISSSRRTKTPTLVLYLSTCSAGLQNRVPLRTLPNRTVSINPPAAATSIDAY